MKNKRAFTLVEVIAVIALLAVISLVAAPSIIKSLKQADENKYNDFLDNLYLASETYLQQNQMQYPELKTAGGNITITVGKLREENLVKAKLTNPKTEKVVTDNSTITVTVESDFTFSYNFVEKP
ncbi:MAG: type II secretion system protein [Bacilli bacterium]|nr:type II secretion system protein [Bacilli bacterium]